MPPDAQPGSSFRPFAMPVRQRSGRCGCQAVRKAKNYDRAPCAGPDDCADLPDRPPRPSVPSRTGRISRTHRPLRGSGRIRTVAALSRHAGRSGGQEVRRSSGQETGRSEDQKVGRSEGQEVRWPRGRKVGRSEDQDTEKVRRPAARRFGPRPFRRRRSTAQRPKRFRHAPPPAIRKRRAPSPEPPLRNRRTGSGWNGSGDGRSTKKDVSFVRCRSAARMPGGGGRRAPSQPRSTNRRLAVRFGRRDVGTEPVGHTGRIGVHWCIRAHPAHETKKRENFPVVFNFVAEENPIFVFGGRFTRLIYDRRTGIRGTRNAYDALC